jgi:hypothetical protein
MYNVRKESTGFPLNEWRKKKSACPGTAYRTGISVRKQKSEYRETRCQ